MGYYPRFSVWVGLNFQNTNDNGESILHQFPETLFEDLENRLFIFETESITGKLVSPLEFFYCGEEIVGVGIEVYSYSGGSVESKWWLEADYLSKEQQALIQFCSLLDSWFARRLIPDVGIWQSLKIC